jgi:hypothetical protein
MKSTALTRKEFIRNSALALAGATFIPGMLFAENQPNVVHQGLLSGYQGKKKLYVEKRVVGNRI